MVFIVIAPITLPQHKFFYRHYLLRLRLETFVTGCIENFLSMNDHVKNWQTLYLFVFLEKYYVWSFFDAGTFTKYRSGQKTDTDHQQVANDQYKFTIKFTITLIRSLWPCQSVPAFDQRCFSFSTPRKTPRKTVFNY